MTRYMDRSEYDDEPRSTALVPMAETPDPLLARLKGINRAKLPEVYSNLKAHIEQIMQINEAKEWEDKLEAAKGWARIYADKEVEKVFRRAKSHARKRAGQLMVESEKAEAKQRDGFSGGQPPKNKTGRGRPTSETRKAAKDAGMSDDQIKSAKKLAQIEPETFAALVDDAEEPATIKELEAVARAEATDAGEAILRAAQAAQAAGEAAAGDVGAPIRKADYKDALALDKWLKGALSASKLDFDIACKRMTPKERKRTTERFTLTESMRERWAESVAKYETENK